MHFGRSSNLAATVIKYSRNDERCQRGWGEIDMLIVMLGDENQRSKFSKINTRSSTPMLMRRDSLRNEPAVLDVGQSFVSDVERI
mmetsp:Transcript_12633/g.8862  ORF Transcript_12633/g.8862 Transcript_12633/m.8862 type:complete len:85 (-) Transcript_12633:71-325(-)